MVVTGTMVVGAWAASHQDRRDVGHRSEVGGWTAACKIQNTFLSVDVYTEEEAFTRCRDPRSASEPPATSRKSHTNLYKLDLVLPVGGSPTASTTDSGGASPESSSGVTVKGMPLVAFEPQRLVVGPCHGGSVDSDDATKSPSDSEDFEAVGLACRSGKGPMAADPDLGNDGDDDDDVDEGNGGYSYDGDAYHLAGMMPPPPVLDMQRPSWGHAEPWHHEVVRSQQHVSVGSARHPDGCVLCKHVTTECGCPYGVECVYCHLCSVSGARARARPCKGKRDRYRRLVSRLMEELEANPSAFDMGSMLLPMSVKEDSHLMQKLTHRMVAHKVLLLGAS
mmetsp:Transcript_41929/g.132511  ORF Transcript_41929/g.132511 Transcript_41929/m.132511 type:complete len:336 (-) Transcript_41929:162-1169(-)